MKRRTILIIGTAFGLILACLWFAKPPSLKHEFEREGLVLTYRGLSDDPDKNWLLAVWCGFGLECLDATV